MRGQWFGYQSVAGALMAWGARAIFKPQSAPTYTLDLLPDRQGHDFKDEDDAKYGIFLRYLNQTVLPVLNELAGYYSPSSSDKLVWHFDWTDDPNLVVVVQGSPNASYGYFYLSASLVERSNAPEIIRPVGYLTAEEKLEQQRRIEQTRRQQQQDNRQFNAQQRTTVKELRKENKEKLGNGPFKNPGDDLMVGDRLSVEANQGQRDAVVRAVVGDETLVEYFMPNGRAFLRVINTKTQGEIRSVSATKIPKKFSVLMN